VLLPTRLLPHLQLPPNELSFYLHLPLGRGHPIRVLPLADGSYWVVDGWHRAACAHIRNIPALWCYVEK
jgi:hypothetical protein